MEFRQTLFPMAALSSRSALSVRLNGKHRDGTAKWENQKNVLYRAQCRDVFGEQLIDTDKAFNALHKLTYEMTNKVNESLKIMRQAPTGLANKQEQPRRIKIPPHYRPDDGNTKHLRHVDQLLRYNTAQYPIRPTFS